MHRRMTESDGVYVDVLATIVAVRAAIESHEPIDPDQLPDKVVEIVNAHCVGRNMPVANGREHYDAFDVLGAPEVRARKGNRK